MPSLAGRQSTQSPCLPASRSTASLCAWPSTVSAPTTSTAWYAATAAATFSLSRAQSSHLVAQTQVFPAPEHRSAALAAQASMLYVILYFAPDILHSERTTMREVVDKHFNDNWVVPVYMGWLVQLDEEWLPYRAAREALANTLQLVRVGADPMPHLLARASGQTHGVYRRTISRTCTAAPCSAWRKQKAC